MGTLNSIAQRQPNVKKIAEANPGNDSLECLRHNGEDKD